MLLEISNLQKHYGDFRLDCSLKVKKGRITGIIGANGAGKTTTFKGILGLIFPENGEIRIFGKNVKELSKEEKRKIGNVMAESGFSPMLKGKEIIQIMKSMYPEFDEEKFLGKCEHYQIPLQKPLKDFSTGMKAKFKILIALSYNADLLILDEPTVGLDYMTRNEILDELRDYMTKEGKGVLISSHISSDLEGVCDDLYFMQKGKIVLHEDADRIVSQYGILKLTEEEYEKLDKKYLLYVMKNAYSIEALTNEKQYYGDNYPECVVEKGSIDQVILFLTKGEAV